MTYKAERDGLGVREDELSATESEALEASVVKAVEENVRLEARSNDIRKREIVEYDLKAALAAEADDARYKANRKYEKALGAIQGLKDGYVSALHNQRTDDGRLEAIARYLLEELCEPTPDDWGD